VSAAIRNESACDVASMKVKLMRFITLRDARGHTREWSDTVAEAKYEGVPKKSEALRYLPLPLVSGSGEALARGVRRAVAFFIYPPPHARTHARRAQHAGFHHCAAR